MENTLDLIIINNKEKNNINKEIYRILKPGGYIFSFDVQSKAHNSVCDIEDIGFLIKDSISYFFKENEDIKQDVICLAMKPLSEKNFAENVMKWGTGVLNIDGTRIETSDNIGRKIYQTQSWKNTSKLGVGSVNDDWKKGRYPANLIISEDIAPVLDKQSDKASRYFKNVDSHKDLLKYITVMGLPPKQGRVLFLGFDNANEIIEEINKENGTSYEVVGGMN